MPDEDQNIGVAPETPAAESSPVETPAETSDQSSEAHDTTPEVSEKPALQTIGDAWNQFAKARKDPSYSQQPQRGQPPIRQGRDYTGLEPNEVAWFKNMGGRAFDELKPKYLEYKKLKTDYEALKTSSEANNKSSFFEHEQAFQLTPEYQNHTANLSQIQAEASHWQKQLANVRAGQPWQPLVFDDKGNVVVGEPQDPSPDGEAVIMNALTQTHIIRSDLNNKLQGIQTGFKTQHQGFMTKLAEVDKHIFQGADQATLDKAAASKMPNFPAHMQNNPLVKTLAKLWVVNDGLLMLLNEKKAAASTQTIKARTAANGGPSSGEVQPASASHGQTVGNVWDEFKKARMGGTA